MKPDTILAGFLIYSNFQISEKIARFVEYACELPMEKLGYAKYTVEFRYSGKNILVKDWKHIWPHLPQMYYQLR